VREALKGEKMRVNAEFSKTTAFFKSFEKSAFSSADGSDENDTPEQWAMRKNTLGERIRKKPGADLVEMNEKFVNYMKRTDAMRTQMVYAKVLDDAIAYVNGISDAFERLFTSLESNLKALRPRIELHRAKHDNLKGSTTRYVLADSKSLDWMYQSMPYSGGVMTLDSDLSEGIYLKVRDYHMLTDEKDINYFQSLYEDQILGYFRKDVDHDYGALIQFDIIEALEREYRATDHDYEEDGALHYVKKEIEKVKRLAAPFLEQPLGEERHPIYACAYNPEIAGESDPKRKSLIAEELGNYGGQPDPEISEQEILFYNAIYGIRASDLSKYSPERFGTDKRPAGAYFSAYYALVSYIRPSIEKTRVITPHIDRRWHTIAALPDLDDGYQAKQFYGVHQALIGGLALRIISWETMYSGHKLYRYFPYQDLDQGFVVSNGSPCDQFYEVLDSLMIDPVAVSDVNDAVQHRINDFIEDEPAASFTKSPLGSAILNGIVLPELATIVPGMGNRPATLMDIATFYAASVPRSEFSEPRLRMLSENTWKYIQAEIERVEDENEVIPAMRKILEEQMRIFPDNVRLYLAEFGSPFAKRVRTILRPVGELATRLHLREVSDAVAALEDELRDL
jgi:hypothetical protein